MTPLYNPRPERWPQVSLKGFFLLVTLLGIVLGWLGVKARSAAVQRRDVAEIRSVGHAIYDYQWPNCPEEPMVGRQAASPLPRWLIDLLGVDFFHQVVYLVLDSSSATDANLEHLDRFAQVRFVAIIEGAPRITNEGLKRLRALPKLRRLVLGAVQIDDEGVAELANLTGLQELLLEDVQVTDAGLQKLKRIAGLRKLLLYDTKVTEAGVAELQRSLPKCEITLN